MGGGDVPPAPVSYAYKRIYQFILCESCPSVLPPTPLVHFQHISTSFRLLVLPPFIVCLQACNTDDACLVKAYHTLTRCRFFQWANSPLTHALAPMDAVSSILDFLKFYLSFILASHNDPSGGVT